MPSELPCWLALKRLSANTLVPSCLRPKRPTAKMYMSAFWSSQALGNEDQDPVIVFQVRKGNPVVQFKAAQLRSRQRLTIPQTLSLHSEILTMASCLCNSGVKSIQNGTVAEGLLGTVSTSPYSRHPLPQLPMY